MRERACTVSDLSLRRIRFCSFHMHISEGQKTHRNALLILRWIYMQPYRAKGSENWRLMQKIIIVICWVEWYPKWHSQNIYRRLTKKVSLTLFMVLEWHFCADSFWAFSMFHPSFWTCVFEFWVNAFYIFCVYQSQVLETARKHLKIGYTANITNTACQKVLKKGFPFNSIYFPSWHFHFLLVQGAAEMDFDVGVSNDWFVLFRFLIRLFTFGILTFGRKWKPLAPN